MFKNHALLVEMVKKNSAAMPVAEETHVNIDPEKINDLIKDQVKHVAIATVAVMTVSAILTTTSQVIINKTSPKK